VFSIFWGVINAILVNNVKISSEDDGTWKHVKDVCDQGKKSDPEQKDAKEVMEQMVFISGKIMEGADSFLK